jgi:diguanylate cyclase (GGDEF)-like protein
MRLSLRRGSPTGERAPPAGAGVAGPRQGTALAAGYALVPFALTVWWAHAHGFAVRVNPTELAALVVLTACAGKISILIGPRSWYSPATPLLVFSALVGGPLAGALAGAASEGLTTNRVWRHRLFGAARSSTEGFAAGLIGLLPGAGAGRDTVRAGLALAIVVLLAQIARTLIIAVRGIRPARRALRVGATTDVIEALVALPLLVVFAAAQDSSALVAVLGLGTLLLSLAFAERAHTLQGLLLEREREVARTDAVTGARNRLAFEEALVREHARIVRGGRPAGLFLVDIDRFKQVNDLYGHAVGDLLLAGVVDRLARSLRGTELVARWGGDELIVLAPDLDGVGSLGQFGERLREAVAAAEFTFGESCSIAVTASVGGTLIDGGTAPELALKRADVAVYRAKAERDASVVEVPAKAPSVLAARLPIFVGTPVALRAGQRPPNAS